MSYNAVKSLLANGVSRPTLYQLILPVSGKANSQLEFLCKSATIPEVRANTLAVNGHEAQGLVREQTTQIVYGNPFEITVICDSDFVVYKEIRSWMGRQNRTIQAQASQRLSYYDEYKRTISLIKLENNANVSKVSRGYVEPFRVRFNNTFPVSLGPLNLASDAYDTYMEFTASFAYETYDFVENSNLLSSALSSFGVL